MLLSLVMDNDLRPLIEQIRDTKKYRQLDLPESTLRDLLEAELPRHRSQKDSLQVVRQKLHNIVAPYLGDPDYHAALTALEINAPSGNPLELKAICSGIMTSHISTRERLSTLDTFYARLFNLIGKPQVILDLACGLNPLAIPWMDLLTGTQYHAYDIHTPRVTFLNHFFRLQGMPELAETRDILVHPPDIEADAAFLFKEAHRFEQRQRGCNRTLWQALQARWLVVSLPTSSMSGRHDLMEKHRRLVYSTLAGLPWKTTELQIENELLFCINKIL
jgi:16S rRNA (guanine(1405)-N(7))-methyltransferase